MASVEHECTPPGDGQPEYIKYSGYGDIIITLRVLPETRNYLLVQSAKQKKSLQVYILEKLGIKRCYSSNRERIEIVKIEGQ